MELLAIWWIARREAGGEAWQLKWSPHVVVRPHYIYSIGAEHEKIAYILAEVAFKVGSRVTVRYLALLAP